MIGKMYDFWINKVKPNIIRFLLFVTKGEILYIVLASMITIWIVTWAIMSKDDVSNVIDLSTFSAVVLEGAMVALVGLLRVRIMNYTEDPNKLTNDYDRLLKKYSAEKNWIKDRMGDKDVVLPVIHVAWLYDKDIIIKDDSEKEYQLPDMIVRHYEELFATHMTSNIYNNVNIRVDDWWEDEKDSRFVMRTGRTSYYNSLVTNRAMDYEWEKGMSIRELFEYGPKLHPLKTSSFSNHLGFSGFIESADEEIVLVYRKKNVSIGKRTYGSSVGASLKAKYALNDGGGFDVEGLKQGMIREIEDELGIAEEELKECNGKGCLGKIQLIAAYRDVVEGGKPQLLFYAKSTMQKAEINKKFQDLQTKSDEEMKLDGDELYWIKKDEISDCNISVKEIVYKEKKHLPMMPSVIASFVMLKQFLEYIKAMKKDIFERLEELGQIPEE